jgi:HSP20 family protein
MVLINQNNKINIMSIVRYNTQNDFVPTSFSSLIDRFFNESQSRSGGAAYSFVPRVDIWEEEKAFEIHVAVPGVAKEDFKIEVNDNVLTISGERKFTKEKKDSNYHSVETQFGAFKRAFTLPENVDAASISAKYSNGILEVIVPKDEKKVLKASIKVN